MSVHAWIENVKARVWELGPSLRGASDELGLVAGDANKSMTTYICNFMVGF
jgi:hypothetical protein